MKVTPKQYAKLLFEVGKSEVANEEKNTQIAKIAGFLIKNRDQKKLWKIEFEFEKLLVCEGKKLPVIIESARKLKQHQITEVKQKIMAEKGISAEIIEIEERIDPKLLGGLKFTIGNEVIDATLIARVGMLRRSLVG